MALKVGSEDKKKVAVAGVLAVVVLFLVGRMIWSDFGGSPAPAATAPVAPPLTPAPVPVSGPVQQRTTVAASRTHQATKVTASVGKLDPTLHPEWMAAAESLQYEGKGRNVFSMLSTAPVIEAVKGPIRPSASETAVAAGPPPPPPIDLKFFGYEANKGGTRKAFLLHGDDVFIAAEGDVVDHRYQVVKIAPTSMQVMDIPYHNTQTLSLLQN